MATGVDEVKKQMKMRRSRVEVVAPEGGAVTSLVCIKVRAGLGWAGLGENKTLW